jgi:hypothetical protein
MLSEAALACVRTLSCECQGIVILTGDDSMAGAAGPTRVGFAAFVSRTLEAATNP